MDYTPTNMAFLGPNDILVLEKDKGTAPSDGKILGEPLLDVNVRTLLKDVCVEFRYQNMIQRPMFLYYTEINEKMVKIDR